MAGISAEAFAHGESIRGGGAGSINTIGAEIRTNPGIGMRWDQRNYEQFSDQQMLGFRNQGEDVHMHSKEDSAFLAFGFPVNKDMDLTILAQYNRFKGFVDNGDEYASACFGLNQNGLPTQNAQNANCLSKTSTSQGLGDTLVLGRYRFYNHNDHQLAAVFGTILPTGTIRKRTNNGDLIGTHNQPGSGAITMQGGLAYTAHLTGKIALDADIIARVPTMGAKQFRSGRSIQADAAISYNHDGFLVPVLEVNAISNESDIENDEVKKNSGGDVVYLSPGITMHLKDKGSVYASVMYPVYQKLGGISNNETWRFSLGWGYGFGK
ncbi:MAG: transporter [Pseudomonadota bacterium]